MKNFLPLEDSERARAWEYLRRLGGYEMPRLGPPLHWIFARTRPRHVKTELLPGVRMTLDLDDHTAHNIYYRGSRYEYPTQKILQDWVELGATHFFDIGANFGYFSFAVAKRCPEIQVVAFEPNPATFQRLQHTVSDNGIGNVQCFQLALSNRKANLGFFSDSQNSGASHIMSDQECIQNTQTITVPTIRFDELWPHADRMGMRAVAKIDAEGHELAILEGMFESLKERRFLGICVEANPDVLNRENRTSEAVFTLLKSHGFKWHSVEAIRRKYGRHHTENHFFTIDG